MAFSSFSKCAHILFQIAIRSKLVKQAVAIWDDLNKMLYLIVSVDDIDTLKNSPSRGLSLITEGDITKTHHHLQVPSSSRRWAVIILHCSRSLSDLTKSLSSL